jgi:periplasmic divalent cation tolerance protein
MTIRRHQGAARDRFMASRRSSADSVLVYVTAASKREAERIALTAVNEGLAACANVLGPIRSVFRWQGKIERAREVALILKTRRSRVAALTRRVKAMHSYSVPCVVALPMLGGNPDYFAWISAESAPRAAPAKAHAKAKAR